MSSQAGGKETKEIAEVAVRGSEAEITDGGAQTVRVAEAEVEVEVGELQYEAATATTCESKEGKEDTRAEAATESALDRSKFENEKEDADDEDDAPKKGPDEHNLSGEDDAANGDEKSNAGNELHDDGDCEALPELAAAEHEAVTKLEELFERLVSYEDEKGVDLLALDKEILAVLEAHPEAAGRFARTRHEKGDRVRDERGDLPLHCAVRYGWSEAREAVVQTLIKLFPSATKEKNKMNQVPLHFALRFGLPATVVQTLIKDYPEVAKVKDKCGWLPLHSLGKNTPEAAIQLVIKQYSDALKQKDMMGGLPLHQAIRLGSSEAVVKFLIKEHPDALRVKTARGGELPLHRAVSEGASDAIVKMLIEEYTEGVKIENDNGALPLHCALRRGSSEVVVQMLIEVYQDSLKVKDIKGQLPLHCAASEASESVIQMLIEDDRGYPEAVKKNDHFGDFPLHFAAKNPSEAVVKKLIHLYRGALMERNSDGQLPLHRAVAVRSTSSEAAILLLIEAWPDAVKVKDDKGKLPLHLAAQSTLSGAVIEKLIFREGAKARDDEGCVPLHYAIKCDLPEAVTLKLIQECPEAAEEEDNDGGLPLHYAIKQCSSETVKLQLINAFPSAAQVKFGGALPLEMAIEKNESKTVLFTLLKSDMPLGIEEEAVSFPSTGRSRSSWTCCVSTNTDNAAAAVGRVLASKNDSPPGCGLYKHIHALAEVKDKDGRTAYDISSPKIRKIINSYRFFCGRYELQMGPPEHRSATSVVLRARDHEDKIDYGKMFDKADKDEDGRLTRDEILESTGIDLDPELFLMGTNSVGKAEFITVCKRQLGVDGPRPVVVKFMQDEEQWKREQDAREKHQLNSDYVVQGLKNVPSDEQISKGVIKKGGGLGTIVKKHLEGIEIGRLAIVMEAADRNLHQIFLQERPNVNTVRSILEQLFKAVAHLHAQRLMHGDLKMLNVVRFQRDGKVRLIDFDAAARIMRDGEMDVTYAGAKFSSAILPPEMFCQLKTESERAQFESYWEDAGADLRSKVAPKECRSGKSYVIKSFQTEGGKPVGKVEGSKSKNQGASAEDSGRPYKLVKASEKIDVWSLGALSFALLAGETLVPTTRDDDCASGEAMRFICEWGLKEGQTIERLQTISDVAARDLVDKMLQRDPLKRLHVEELLNTHPFFHPKDPGIKKKLDEIQEEQRKQTRELTIIKDLSFENKDELRHSCKVLLKGMFEATEVTTPTTFIILPQELPSLPTEEENKQLMEIAEDGSGVELKNGLISVSLGEDGAMVEAYGKLKEHMETLDAGMKWLKGIKDVFMKIDNRNVKWAVDTIKEGLGNLVTDEPMYLYLVDELTGTPVRAEGWPILIETPGKIVPKLLPVMQIGLRAMSIYNGAVGIAHMCGFPVPRVPSVWADGARDSVDLLKQKSSVEKFESVQEVVDSDEKKSESLRGASLRQFKDFLNNHDPGLSEGRSGHFAGLQRICDPMGGTALWTTLDNAKAISAAIEKRTGQRKAEERNAELRETMRLCTLEPQAVTPAPADAVTKETNGTAEKPAENLPCISSTQREEQREVNVTCCSNNSCVLM